MDSTGERDYKDIAQDWAGLRRRPLLWGWILQGSGLLSSTLVMYLLSLAYKHAGANKELVSRISSFHMEFNVVLWYLLNGLVIWLALDRIRYFSNVIEPGNPGGSLLQRYRTEFNSAIHLIALFILPASVLMGLVFLPVGIRESVAWMGIGNTIGSYLLSIAITLAGFVLMAVVIVGLSVLASRLALIQQASIGVLAMLLESRLEGFLSTKAKDLMAISQGEPTPVGYSLPDMGYLYLSSVVRLLVAIIVIGWLCWLLGRREAGTAVWQPRTVRG
ncbi:hypothetical protein KDL29_06135 [bacterium]|nr:hypothetical protein [bacterium]